MSQPQHASRFESAVLEHLDAAHDLARWLLRSDQDADDAVQESCMKAMRAYDSLRGSEFRPWFLTIVRNTCFTWLSRRKGSAAIHQSLESGAEVSATCEEYDPQLLAERAADVTRVREAIDRLPLDWREIIVLREMENLSYKEIGRIVGIPIGTVMSRLARARRQLQALLMQTETEGVR